MGATSHHHLPSPRSHHHFSSLGAPLKFCFPPADIPACNGASRAASSPPDWTALLSIPQRGHVMSQQGGAARPAYLESIAAKVSGWSDPEARLREAFADDEFMLLGQSIVSLDGTKHLPFRLELLVRLMEEEVNLQPPGAFFPALEACGMMPLLDRWVVARAGGWCRDRNGARNMVLHVNLAPQSLEDEDFTQYVLAQVLECQMPAAAFCFELPVTDVASASAQYLSSVEKLKAAGCGIAV